MTESPELVIIAPPDHPVVSAITGALPSASIRAVPADELLQADLSAVRILLGNPEDLSRALPLCPALEWAQSTWAGVNALLASPRHDYQLTALKGVFGQAMSEYALGWLLALERGILERCQTREWRPEPEPGLAGKTLGIMGTGTIGSAVAEAAAVFGLRVRGLNSTGRGVEPFEGCFSTGQRLAFADGLDYLLSVLPATPATDGLIDAGLLERLNPGAILINAGRGTVLVDDDLLAALASGRVRSAVLDVFREEPLPREHPFWHDPSIYITSHTAAPTADRAVVEVFLDNYQRFCSGQPLLHRVDFGRGY